VLDCITRTVQEEGAVALYKSLGPRLISVVPMIGIQVNTLTKPILYVVLASTACYASSAVRVYEAVSANSASLLTVAAVHY
jgi:Mitochondrial carrier protein